MNQRHVYRPPRRNRFLSTAIIFGGGAMLTFMVFYFIPLMQKLEQGLAQEQQDLSNQYARKEQHEVSPEHYRIGKNGAPVIRNSLVSFECELDATHEGGDHLIIVGRVTEVSQRPTGKPLVFCSGGYKEIR